MDDNVVEWYWWEFVVANDASAAASLEAQVGFLRSDDVSLQRGLLTYYNDDVFAPPKNI